MTIKSTLYMVVMVLIFGLFITHYTHYEQKGGGSLCYDRNHLTILGWV